MISLAEYMREIERLHQIAVARDTTYQNAREAYFRGRCRESELSYAYVMRLRAISEMHRQMCSLNALLRAQNREAEFVKINRMLLILQDAIEGNGEGDDHAGDDSWGSTLERPAGDQDGADAA